jgi:hypothetical protein
VNGLIIFIGTVVIAVAAVGLARRRGRNRSS